MNVRELRIGNKVFENVLGVCTVTSIWELGTGVSVNNGSDEDYNIQSENVSSIELTPEILIACGFERIDDVVFGMPQTRYRLNDFVFISSLNWRGNSMTHESLHQLQNLYFALTGTELVFSDVLKMVK